MKDPAFLFYPGDWMGGTILLNRSQKGCYIDLLVAQFNNGPLTLEEIKTLLGPDFGQWPKIEKKFTFMDGRYYNQRLETEKSKRSTYTDSRRKNRKSYDESYVSTTDNHMTNHMENRNENINYLRVLPGEDLEEFYKTFEATKSQIQSKAEDLLLYCQSKGKKYKDYRSFLINALKKDFSKRKVVEKPKEVELQQGRGIPSDIKESARKLFRPDLTAK